MNQEKSHGNAVRYAQSSERMLLERIPWLATHKFRLQRNTPESPRARAFRIGLAILTRLMRTRENCLGMIDWSKYIATAPNQPRPLQIQDRLLRQQVSPLSFEVGIDGSVQHCRFRYADAVLSWNQWMQAERDGLLQCGQPFSYGDQGDISYVIEMIEALLDNRFGLLRTVRFQMGYSGMQPTVLDLFSPLADPEVSIELAKTTETTAEAILYTWTGDGDRYVVPPRYAEIKRLVGFVDY